jgi:hypothetical protein
MTNVIPKCFFATITYFLQLHTQKFDNKLKITLKLKATNMCQHHGH